MRILYVSTVRPWNAETEQTLRVARGLAARGHAASWLAPPGAESLARAQASGIPCAVFRGADFKRSVSGFLSGLSAVRREVARHSPDVVYAVESPAHLLSALALTGRRRTRLVRWRGSALPLRRRPMSAHLYDRRTHAVLAPCERAVREAGAAGLDTRRWHVVDGCVDLERFRPGAPEPALWAEAGLDPGTPVAVLVARLAPVKGVRWFLEALAAARARVPGLAGLVIGEAWEGEEAKFHADVRRLGLGGVARWLGRREDVERWLRLGRVGVVSSVGSEMHSRAALEYMATALPVAATRVGVLPEWLEGKPWARLVPPQDGLSLGEAVADLAAGSPAPAARAEAEARFTETRMLGQVEAILRAAVEAE